MTARTVQPHPGPIGVDPTGLVYAAAVEAHGATFSPSEVRDVAASMLDTALASLPLGAYDARIVKWLSGQDIDVTATIASLLRRAWLAGVAAGRADALDETGGTS